MKLLKTPPGLFIPAVVLIVAVNAVVLAGVAYNKGGTPEARVRLSERELQMPYRLHEENSGLSLRLAWRVLSKGDDHSRSSPDWLTPEKLKALGFDPAADFDSGKAWAHTKEPLPRIVFIVLENNGPAYREAVARAAAALQAAESLYRAHPENEKLHQEFETAEKQLARERFSESRLFAVDAGRNPKVLRAAYADRSRFIIARGAVRLSHHYEKETRRVQGYISNLVVESIHVPLGHRKQLDTFLGKETSRNTELAPPRYEVVLAYGLRFEPWIVSVQGTGPTSG